MKKDALIQEAYRHLRDRQWDQAIQQLIQVIQLDPSDANTHLLLAGILSHTPEINRALAHYREAFALYSQKKDRSRVELLKKQMKRIDPDSLDDVVVPPVINEPNEQLNSEKYKTTLHRLKQTLASDKENPKHLTQLAEFLLEYRQKRDAVNAFLAAGNMLYNAKKYTEAKPIFARILEIEPFNFQSHIAMGEIYSRENSDSDAKKEYLAAAARLIRLGDIEKGQYFAQKAIQLKSIEAHYYLGLAFFLKNKVEEAQQEIETLLRFKVNHQAGLMCLAMIYCRNQNWEDALATYDRLYKLDEKNPAAAEEIGYVQLELGHSDQALAFTIQAMDLYAEEEQWERAAACAHRAVKLDSRNQELYLKLADATYNAGLIAEASEACLALADILEKSGKSESARQMRDKAAELRNEPKGTAVDELMPPLLDAPEIAPDANTSVSPLVEKPSAAVPELKREKKSPAPKPVEDTQVLMNMANTYIQQSSLDEAIEIYQKILKREPANEVVKQALTRVYAMFAGLNPETAVARPNAGEKQDQDLQRVARENATREAEMRSRVQRKAAPTAPAIKGKAGEEPVPAKDADDSIESEGHDEFMTVTVAEIYTKQGLLNEALKIYEKIIEIEPDSQEAKTKWQELRNKLDEQEGLNVSKEDVLPAANEQIAVEQPSIPAQAEEKPKPKNEEPPTGKGRGRVSYI